MMGILSNAEIEQLKSDLRDYDEGEEMQINVNIIADLLNEVEEYRGRYLSEAPHA
jgi:uncharacterized membrane protein YgcG